jgi:hypothetical protein
VVELGRLIVIALRAEQRFGPVRASEMTKGSSSNHRA